MNIRFGKIEKSNDSIRKQLYRSYILIIASLLLISVLLYLLSMYALDKNLKEMEKQLFFSSFFSKVKEVQLSLEDYLLVPKEEQLKICNRNGSDLQAMANDLAVLYSSPAFTDNVYITETYLERVGDTIGKKKTTGRYYQELSEAQYLKELIEHQYDRLLITVSESSKKQASSFRTYMRLFALFGILIVVGGIISFLYTQRFSQKLIQPLQDLAAGADRIAKGSLCPVVTDYKKHDEIGLLIRTFNQMVKTIKRQIGEIKEKAEIEKRLQEVRLENILNQKLLRESELKVLQSNINPHFLFNTLNIIAQNAYIEHAEKTRDMSIALSNLLRYSLQNINQIVTVENEIDSVSDYIYILKQRFGNRIRFEIRCDDDCRASLIPAMSLQPLLENSIKHGIGKYSSGGRAGIAVKAEGARIKICIYDNGVGITDAKKNDLLQRLYNRETVDDANGVGLFNVYSRMKLFFGEQFVLSISSDPGVRTEICMYIPRLTEEDGHV